jgi:hypothetical protein
MAWTFSLLPSQLAFPASGFHNCIPLDSWSCSYKLLVSGPFLAGLSPTVPDAGPQPLPRLTHLCPRQIFPSQWAEPGLGWCITYSLSPQTQRCINDLNFKDIIS